MIPDVFQKAEVSPGRLFRASFITENGSLQIGDANFYRAGQPICNYTAICGHNILLTTLM